MRNSLVKIGRNSLVKIEIRVAGYEGKVFVACCEENETAIMATISRLGVWPRSQGLAYVIRVSFHPGDDVLIYDCVPPRYEMKERRSSY